MAGMYYRTPRFGLTLWFTYLTSTIVASIGAIVITIWGLYDFFQTTWGRDSIELELLNTLGIWVLVAISGIVISVINLRTEPLVIEAGTAKKDLVTASQPHSEFAGYQVRVLPFALPLAFVAKVEGAWKIYVSAETFKQLDGSELEAMYWHEVGHIRGRHSLINSIAKYIALFTPMFRASAIFIAETRTLTELMADNFAKRKVSAQLLERARSKFLE